MTKNVAVPLRLKALRLRAGLSMAVMAKALGKKGASSYQRYEDPDLYTRQFLPLHIVRGFLELLVGKGSPPISREEIFMLAGVTDLSGSQLKSLDAHSLVWCVGEVAGGIWREAFEWPRGDWLPVINSMLDDRYPDAERSAVRVRGDAMDLLYPEGSFVFFVRLDDVDRKPKPGDRVIVLRHRNGQTESTIKEYSRDAQKRRWLLPRSTNPDHKAIPLEKSGADGEVVEILGLVVGSQRIE